MNNVKLFEAYNRDETLLGLAKMGLRTNRKEVFDLAVSRGFNIKKNFYLLGMYCDKIFNYKSLEWIYPNKQEYQNFINNITELYCSVRNLTTLEGISCLTNLRILDCSHNNLTTLKGIENLSQLTELDCYKNNLTSLKELKQLTRLNKLYCYNNEIASLHGIEKLTNLRNIDCADNKITSLQGIENLNSLEYLTCYTNKITSLKQLKGLNLVSISVNNNSLPQEIIVMGDSIPQIQKYYSN